MKIVSLVLSGIFLATSCFAASWTWKWSANDADNALQTAIDTYGDTGGVTNISTAGATAISASGAISAGTDLTVGDSATINTNLSVGKTLTIGAPPVFTTQQGVTGTPVAAAGILLPEGASTNAAKLLKISIGTTNYVIAVWQAN